MTLEVDLFQLNQEPIAISLKGVVAIIQPLGLLQLSRVFILQNNPFLSISELSFDLLDLSISLISVKDSLIHEGRSQAGQPLISHVLDFALSSADSHVILIFKVTTEEALSFE
jgi:hypothetical protein